MVVLAEATWVMVELAVRVAVVVRNLETRVVLERGVRATTAATLATGAGRTMSVAEVAGMALRDRMPRRRLVVLEVTVQMQLVVQQQEA